MGRDHSIECEKCGTYYGGFNGPEVCLECNHRDVIVEAAIAFVNARCSDEGREYSMCEQCGDDCGACGGYQSHATWCNLARAEEALRRAVTGETSEGHEQS